MDEGNGVRALVVDNAFRNGKECLWTNILFYTLALETRT